MFWAYHTAFATNQNWSGSSFPKPLKMGNFTIFAILNAGGGGGGVGKGVCNRGEDGGGVGGWGIRGNPCLINWIALCSELVLLLHCHSEEAQLASYIQDLFSFYP